MRNPLLKLLTPVSKLYTQWTDFAGRRPKKLQYEEHICVIKGKELFSIVSPIFRKNLYVNAAENMMQGETPLDFFNVDYTKYPLAKQVNFVKVLLEAGDCMYVPAYFYVQSRTQTEGGGESILITSQYLSHSRFVDLFMDALDADLIDGEGAAAAVLGQVGSE